MKKKKNTYAIDITAPYYLQGQYYSTIPILPNHDNITLNV